MWKKIQIKKQHHYMPQLYAADLQNDTVFFTGGGWDIHIKKYKNYLM